MLCDWEGNRGSGVALFYPPVGSLPRNGDEHPARTFTGMPHFTFTSVRVRCGGQMFVMVVCLGWRVSGGWGCKRLPFAVHSRLHDGRLIISQRALRRRAGGRQGGWSQWLVENSSLASWVFVATEWNWSQLDDDGGPPGRRARALLIAGRIGGRRSCSGSQSIKRDLFMPSSSRHVCQRAPVNQIDLLQRLSNHITTHCRQSDI